MARKKSFRDALKEGGGAGKQKYSFEYWRSELERAKTDQENRKFDEFAKASIEVFESKKFIDSENARRLNVWWSVVSTLMPAYYSRPPKIEGTLRKKSGTPIHNLGTIALERTVQYQVDEEFDFDGVAFDALLSWQLTGRGVLWANYKHETEKKKERYGVLQTDKGLEYGDGEAYDESHGAIVEDGGGRYVEEEIDAKSEERATLEAPHWTDYREQSARRDEDCEWKAKRGWLTREQAAALLGKDTAEKLSYHVLPEQVEKNRSAKDAYEFRAEVWDLRCIASEKQYLYSPSGKEKGGMCEAGPSPIKFAKFFPCVTFGANRSLDSTIPVSDYAELKDSLLEIERLTMRVHGVLQAIRVNCAYDSSLGEDIEKIFTGDLRFIPVKWLQAKGEQALERSVMWTPVDRLVQVLQVLMESREVALQKVYEQTGSTDLMRGMVDPNETATASEIKQTNSSLRFRFRQAQVHKFLSGGVKLLKDIVCEEFSGTTIYQISNIEEVLAQMQLPQGTDPMMVWEQCAELLKSGHEREYRIEIATDSMLALDELKERKDRTDLLESVGTFIGKMQPMLALYPSITPLLVTLTKYACDSYKAGKELKDVFTQLTQGIGQEAQQQRQMMNDQASAQKGAAEGQMKVQVAQINAQTKMAELQLTSQTEKADNMVKQQQAAMKAQAEQLKAFVQMQQLKHDGEAKASESALKLQDQEIKAIIEAAKMKIELVYADIEKQKLHIDASSKQHEAKIREHEAGQIKSPIHIHAGKDGAKVSQEKPKSKKRVGRIKRNKETGETTVEIEEVG